MPVNIQVDEAYAFDYLSILEVKFKNKPSAQTEVLISESMIQLGHQIPKINDILISEEYKNLKKINAEIFKMVDKIKKSDINARVVDALNYERFVAKQKLQEKFFPKKKLRETKIGY